MSRISVKIKANNDIWSLNKRPRVGDTVAYQGFLFANVTGRNAEPGLTSDWLNVGMDLNAPLINGNHVFNKLVTDISNNPHIIVSGTYVSGDPTKLESYSANSIFREL